MRLLFPAAVMLVYACGASTPGPASAPTPALDFPPLGRAGSRATLAAREQYYDIDGSSAGALRDQIRRLGPKDESGTSHDALTVWSLEWGYATARRGDSCALRDVKVTLHVSVTLPRWTPPATARSEEHTSELQSRLHLVCRLLLEKKKKQKDNRVQIENDVAEGVYDKIGEVDR